MDSTSYRVPRNRSSASAIPRPTSGTSRRATPTGFHLWKAGSIPYVQAQKRVSNLQRKSWHPNDTAHYSSISLPSTEQSDLSSPCPASTPPNASLPKSRTLGSLLASSREVTPSGRLMQPIHPPLPRSQTLGNISCFSQSALTPSPRKPTQAHPDVLRPYQYTQSQSEVSGISKDRRMTQKEMEIMKNVQREAAATRTRMRNSLGKGPAVLRTPTVVKQSSSVESTGGDHSQSRISGVGRPVCGVHSTERLSRANLRNQSLLAMSIHETSDSAETDDLSSSPLLPTSNSWRQESLNPKNVRNIFRMPCSPLQRILTRLSSGVLC